MNELPIETKQCLSFPAECIDLFRFELSGVEGYCFITYTGRFIYVF